MENTFTTAEETRKIRGMEDVKIESGTINVAIDRNIHREFGVVCKDRPIGRSMGDTLNEIVKWFCRQEQYVRTAITSDADRGMHGAYADALAKLATEHRQMAIAEIVEQVEIEDENVTAKAPMKRLRPRREQR